MKKSNQKTFAPGARGNREKKFFAELFFKKATAFFCFTVLVLFCADIWQRSTFVAPRPTAILLDRHGVFMAQLGGGPAGYGYWPVGQVPQRVAVAILALEDRRFWAHPGVDPVAVLRAAARDVASGRRVSGASTLAMQVARMQHPEVRSLPAKFMEAAAALVMTARYGREGVLAQYLRLAPFGQDGHGIAYAAQWYFARPVGDLSWAQIALLAAIPQAPGLYNLDNPNGLRRAKARAVVALGRLAAQGVIDGPEYAEALTDLSALKTRPVPARPPDALHAILRIETLVQAGPPQQQLHSSIDLGLQAQMTAAMQARLAQLAPFGAQQAAVMVVDRASMAVLAFAGSAQYGPVNDGEIDYASCMRSPGSTLKPFIYAQALDLGVISPGTVLQDGPDSGTQVDDADRRFLGPMLVAQALANSRNVPAAALVRLVGLERSRDYLVSLGLNEGAAPGRQYGLGIAIGAMPTALDRLVTAYGALANGGELAPLRWYDAQQLAAPARVMSENSARTITLFLADPMARLPSFARLGATEFPFPVAVKTGTSQGYRDAWVLEYTDKYVVGVWVGRPDGRPMDGISGAAGAALIGRDILMGLYGVERDGQDDAGFAPPAGGVPEMVAYIPGGGAAVPAGLRIVAPLDHSVFILDPDAPPGLAMLPLRVAGGGGEVEWLVDGRQFQMAQAGETVAWPAVPGRHVFVAVDADGAMRSRPVVVEVR